MDIQDLKILSCPDTQVGGVCVCDPSQGPGVGVGSPGEIPDPGISGLSLEHPGGRFGPRNYFFPGFQVHPKYPSTLEEARWGEIHWPGLGFL